MPIIYERRGLLPSGGKQEFMRIAIVGAGISGLACADGLVDQGHDVTLFDKGRGPGGRMSTKRLEEQGQTLRFDHGAQYFTVRDPDFAAQVAKWERDGVVTRWPEAGGDAWVGTPGMNAPVRAMAAAHKIVWATRIDTLSRDGGEWRLGAAAGSQAFDAVVVAVPSEQAGPLLAPVQTAFAGAAVRSRSAPCWTAMVAFAEPLRTDRTILRDLGPIGWATRNGAKPGRGNTQTWVVQASPAWSGDHLERSPEEVAPELLRLLELALGVPLPTPIHLSAHRWRYARSGCAGGPAALWDRVIGLGVCGDWLLAPRVEAAWRSGRRLASLIG